MPEKRTIEKARQRLREGKRASTAAGEFVREEIEHVRSGKHGARSPQQAIAIGLSQARRAGVPLPPPKKGRVKERTRRSAEAAYAVGQGKRKPRSASRKRGRATSRALKREPRTVVTRRALSAAAKRGWSRRRRAGASRPRKRSRWPRLGAGRAIEVHMSTGRDLDVVVVGGANWDYLVRAGRLPAAGETLEGDVFQEAPGGKGANQAVAAARLGARAAFVGRVGAERHGEELVERLRREGVDVSRVVRDPGAETGVALVHVDSRGRKSILVHPGANQRLTVEDVRAAAGIIERAAVVIAQLEVQLRCVEEAFRIARRAGARVLLDPAPARRLPERLLRLVDVIRPNASEAEVITGVAVRGRRSAAAAAQVLLQRGVRGVAMEAGDEGNLLLTADEEIWLERLPVESVDATGAGDAFVAALAVAFAERLPVAQAARLANAASAFATTRLGAQAGLPTRAELRGLLEREPQPEEIVLDGTTPPAP